MTSASPYRHDRVAVRTENIANGLDIPMAARDVVPTYGAIAHVKFETHTGQSLLVHSKMADGSVPPIGANVFNADGKNNGIVGTNGDIYIPGVLARDRLLVKWGSDIGESCSLFGARSATCHQTVDGLSGTVIELRKTAQGINMSSLSKYKHLGWRLGCSSRSGCLAEQLRAVVQTEWQHPPGHRAG